MPRLHSVRLTALFVVALAILVVTSIGTESRADTVVEAWRSPFGVPHSTSVNPTDGSVWTISGAWVLHLANDGTVLYRSDVWGQATSISVDGTDGSTYLGLGGLEDEFGKHTDTTVVHLAADGTELWRVSGLGGLLEVAASPSDGSVWVGMHAQMDDFDPYYPDPNIVHLSAEGATLWQGYFAEMMVGLRVDPQDGSCWFSVYSLSDDAEELLHVAADGTSLWQGTGAWGAWGDRAVDARDHSCWVVVPTQAGSYELVRLSPTGEELDRFAPADMSYISSISVSADDRSIWLCGDQQVLHLTAAGSEMWRGPAYYPGQIQASPSDGSCWYSARDGLVHLGADGEAHWWGPSFPSVTSVAAGLPDGSVWITAPDTPYSHLVHYAANGDALWEGLHAASPVRAAVDTQDGSIWVIDGSTTLLHLSSSGVELQRLATMTDLQNLAVNATDSTCWVIDGNQLVHLDSGGEELWRGGDFPGGGGWDKGLAVDSGDGSVWVTEPELSSRITHLRADGIELGRVELDSLCVAVSVDPGDHSCWIADRGFIFGRSYYGGRVYHVSAEGTVLSTTDFRCGSVAVNLEDHSCWAADIGQLQVVHLAPDGTELGRGGTFRYDAAVSVDPQDGSCWLADTSNGQVSHLGVVPEAGFTTNVLSGEVSFIDTSTGYPKAWAWDFGDGTTSAAQSPTHQYWASGTYVVSLTASNAYGFDTSVREIPIAVALEELSGWPRDGGSGSPALGDLEGDGDPEVVGSLDGVHAWHADGTLVTGWPQMVGSNMTDPALADLDRDGALEVIAGSYAGQVHVWHADGTSAAGWPQAVGAPVTSAQAAGDIDGDGWPEIVAAGQDGRVYVWSWDGSPVAGWPQEAGGTLTTYPALGDLDSDGRLEVVAGAGNGSVYAWHGDGTALAGWPRTTGDAIDGFPALGDMDGDGALDVVTGSWDGNVYAWHADGSLVAGWPQLTGPSDYSGEPAVVGSVALGDLDADGGLEVVVGAADGKVYAWHASGVLESGWPQATLGFGFGSPSLADLDGDGLLEVIIGVAHSGMSGWITAWHADGTPVVGFDINGGYYVLDSPALADLDMDGRVEMAIGLLGSTTHVWKLPTTTTDLMPWPMFHHDAQRTGLYEPTALPQAEFSATPTSGPASLTVHFSDRSSGRPISWAWDFGDGAVSVAQSPAHVYTTAGTFTVSLTVANALGTDTETKASLISVAPALHADFTATPTNGSAPLAVQFTDLSTGTPTSWNWDFGDGATSAAQHPAHTYSTPGRRTVNLTVTNAYGSSVEAKSRYVVVSFPDVDTAHWAIDEILACVDAGIVFGYPDGKYYPDLAVTRDQMAVYVSRALVSPSGDAAIPDGPATPSFSDVPSGHWAYRHIEYAVSQNVVKGYEDGTYLPGVAVDRGQMAAYVARAMVAPGGDAGIPDGPAAPSFSDVPTTFWAYKQVEYCVGQGVVRGYEDGLYHPEIVVTRDQMAVYVARTFELPL